MLQIVRPPGLLRCRDFLTIWADTTVIFLHKSRSLHFWIILTSPEAVWGQNRLGNLCAKTNITNSQRFIIFFRWHKKRAAANERIDWLSEGIDEISGSCQGKCFLLKVQHSHSQSAKCQMSVKNSSKNGIILRENQSKYFGSKFWPEAYASSKALWVYFSG